MQATTRSRNQEETTIMRVSGCCRAWLRVSLSTYSDIHLGLAKHFRFEGRANIVLGLRDLPITR